MRGRPFGRGTLKGSDALGGAAWNQAHESYITTTSLTFTRSLEHLGTRAERLVQQSAYWYSVWSHRRGGHWKGFVAVDLAPADDLAAGALLNSLADGDAP